MPRQAENKKMTTTEDIDLPSELPEADSAEQTKLADVTPATMIGFLLGRKASILTIYNCPKILWVGALLVLSAGFAREYDGEDLLSEPWHVLIPHAASFLTSILLYAMLRLPAVRSKAAFRQVVKDYPRFLALYWLTAPLAWLYAIPFERWQNPGQATFMNLHLLAAVSAWRVALIIRSAIVVYKPATKAPVIITVLLFGDAVMLAAIYFVPVPIFQLMGGIRLSESELLLRSTMFFLQLAGYPTLLVLLVLYLVTLPPTRIESTSSRHESGRIRFASWIVAALSVAIWAVFLPYTQPEQQLRRDVERRMAKGDLEGALDVMRQHDRSEFPPHWSPPPQIALPNQAVELTDVMDIVLDIESDSWVREVYMDKFLRKMPDLLGHFAYPSSPQVSEFIRILRRLPPESWRDSDDDESYYYRSSISRLAENKDDEYSAELQADAAAILEMLDAAATDDSGEPTESKDTQADVRVDLEIRSCSKRLVFLELCRFGIPAAA